MVNVGGAAPIIICNDLLAVWDVGGVESVTCTVKLDVPAAVGVPEITPAVLTVRPAGSVPLARLHAKGGVPPVAVTVRV